ncbi:MAG: DEAD/DEAH box helicase [Gammaproteobacteria bacterium]|nr:DEAD/DEAH box helicase [Gammaproteobacteria bacterium]MDP2141797.1 DEAD/DEAH box helicase [Gammaproteobacteria bacterium]MDP2348019.1 DEAD/DEAH box helicase [Gammaproteobacteria bacterium]
MDIVIAMPGFDGKVRQTHADRHMVGIFIRASVSHYSDQPQESSVFSELQLDQRLLKSVDKLGFETPTPVQLQAIPLALAGRDLLVNAATGSGKTAAFLLPILQRMITHPGPKEGTRALVLVPTRELARQIGKECEKLASYCGIKVGVITGGQEFSVQRALLRRDPQIVIATPGRTLELVKEGTTLFTGLETLVLDEADRLFEMGFIDDVLAIIATCNPERQTMLLSATLPAGVRRLMQVLNDPERVTVNTAREQHDSIKQQYILADDDKHKEKLLLWLLENETFERALVFTNTKDQANHLCGVMRYRGQRAGFLHGDVKQDIRNSTTTAFREGKINVLVASDVASRGLDVKGIDLVVNFDMARKGDDYVHRIGRTGRAGEQGLAVAFIAPNEWNLKASIERYLNVTFESRKIKELPGTYKGPKKLKASGKAAGPAKSKKKKS